jgi:site-specific DNA-methyltransferase (adenine-specific)
VQSKAEKFHHPSTFPLELPRWCIRLHGVPHPVVLDPFMGTGTTMLAAALERGQGIGIELDPSYLTVARQRLKTMQGELIAGAPP